MINNNNNANGLAYTGNLFEEFDRVDEDLIPDGSMAFTAAEIAPDGDFVEVFELSKPKYGRHFYEFRGLGLDDVVVETGNSLEDPNSVLSAIHHALQIKLLEAA